MRLHRKNCALTHRRATQAQQLWTERDSKFRSVNVSDISAHFVRLAAGHLCATEQSAYRRQSTYFSCRTRTPPRLNTHEFIAEDSINRWVKCEPFGGWQTVKPNKHADNEHGHESAEDPVSTFCFVRKHGANSPTQNRRKSGTRSQKQLHLERQVRMCGSHLGEDGKEQQSRIEIEMINKLGGHLPADASSARAPRFVACLRSRSLVTAGSPPWTAKRAGLLRLPSTPPSPLSPHNPISSTPRTLPSRCARLLHESSLRRTSGTGVFWNRAPE